MLFNEFLLVNLKCPLHFTEEQYFKEKQNIELSSGNQKLGAIKVTLFELELLRLLAIHRLLSTEQILKLHNTYYPITRRTLRRKFSRWCEKGVVVKTRPSSSLYFGYNNVYSIGQIGLQLLADNSYLSKDCLIEDTTEYTKGLNFTHTIGQQDIAINLFSDLAPFNLFFETIRPSRYFTEQEVIKYGIPDWLLRYYQPNQYKLIFIEFDTGTERGKQIHEKFNAYINRAIDNPDQDILVVFAVMDESFHYRGDRIPSGKRRIGNLKHFFLKVENLIPPNLTIKISYRNRIQSIIKSELLGCEKSQIFNALQSHLTKLLNYKVKDVTSIDLYMKEVHEKYYADQILEIHNKDGLIERVGVIIINEADISSFIRVINFYQVLKDRLFKKTISRLILIYEDEQALLNDPYNFQFDKSILLTDYVSLQEEREIIFNQFVNMNSTKKLGYNT